jgi:hypothetical protein
MGKLHDDLVVSVNFRGEQEIRKEWNKNDENDENRYYNPEVAVIDLKTCKVLGKRFLAEYGWEKAGHTDFKSRYFAMRKAILGIPGVPELLNISPFDLNQVFMEEAKIQMIRAMGVLEKSKEDAYADLEAQSKKDGLEVRSKNLTDISVTKTREALAEDNAKTQRDYQLMLSAP